MQNADDIFISYAHLDNQSPFDDPGWVSAFHRALEVRVAQLLGKKPRIWRDPELTGNDVFPEKLSERIRKAVALVCVLSPRYVKSDWCQRELDEFSNGPRPIVGDDAKARVFKVVKTYLPIERQPEPIQPLLGYEFYKMDPETRRVQELDVTIDPTAKRDYLARLDDLAHDLRDLLEKVDAGSASETNGAKGTVYLAETSLDLKDDRDSLRRDLLRHGYRVLPDRSLPLAADELEDVVREQTQRAQLAIHLIGDDYGVVPEGTSRSIVELQNEIAADRAGTGALQRLVWMQPDLEVRDPRQQTFIEAVRDDERTYLASDLLEVPLEDLKTQVHHRLEALEREEPEPAAEAAGGPPQLYLICDQRDEDSDNLRALEDFLFERGFEVVLPQFEGDEDEVRQDHVANLTASEAFLFFYGAGSSQWVRHQLRELEKSRGYPGKQPTLAHALYISGPPSRDKKRFRTHLAPLTIRESEAFDAADLEPFLTELDRGRKLRNS